MGEEGEEEWREEKRSESGAGERTKRPSSPCAPSLWRREGGEERWRRRPSKERRGEGRGTSGARENREGGGEHRRESGVRLSRIGVGGTGGCEQCNEAGVLVTVREESAHTGEVCH